MQRQEKREVKEMPQDLETRIGTSQNTLRVPVNVGRIRNSASFASSSGKSTHARTYLSECC